MSANEQGTAAPLACPSIYPPSATGPYSDERGWSGPLRCVLSHSVDKHLHANSGIFWKDGEQVAAKRKSSLSTLDWYRLNQACAPIWEAFGGTYLVGTAANGGEYRDVDVRTILTNDEFDRLFSGNEDLWALISSSIAMRLATATGLPIDYQIQRMTEANEKYPGGWRHPVGMVTDFAGGGDATCFTAQAEAREKACTCSTVSGLAFDCPEHGSDVSAAASTP